MELIASITNAVEALNRTLAAKSETSYGPQASTTLKSAIEAEAAELAAWTKAQFSTLTGVKENG